jgi:hypothetical protein
LIVGDEQEADKPTHRLAAFSFATRTALRGSIPFFVLSRRRSMVTEQPARRGPNDYANR